MFCFFFFFFAKNVHVNELCDKNELVLYVTCHNEQTLGQTVKDSVDWRSEIGSLNSVTELITCLQICATFC